MSTIGPTPLPTRRRLPALLGAAVLAFGAAACGEDESAGPESAGGGTGGAGVAAEAPAQGAAAQPGEVTLSELLENPAAYVGRQVVVSGRVTEADVDRDAARPAAFTLGEGVDEDVLVLPTAQANVRPSEITGETVLRVRGMVREVDEPTLAEEEELLYEEGEDAFLVDYADEVAIVANAVDPSVPTEDGAAAAE